MRRATPIEQEITVLAIAISIHALLAESDPIIQEITILTIAISIHALLAESDKMHALILANPMLFLSTLSLRRATDYLDLCVKYNIFLSTLSLRRATPIVRPLLERCQISIHALLAESDVMLPYPATRFAKFLSTLSLRRATILDFFPTIAYNISIHALLAESDIRR